MYSQGCTTIEELRIRGQSGRAGGLEDGPEMSPPQSEQEERGDVLEGMYTSDMLDEKGKPVLARAQMSAELAYMARRLGRAGGPELLPAMEGPLG
jgi:hypothetical protein